MCLINRYRAARMWGNSQTRGYKTSCGSQNQFQWGTFLWMIILGILVIFVLIKTKLFRWQRIALTIHKLPNGSTDRNTFIFLLRNLFQVLWYAFLFTTCLICYILLLGIVSFLLWLFCIIIYIPYPNFQYLSTFHYLERLLSSSKP